MNLDFHRLPESRSLHKIALFIANLNGGGAEKAIFHLANGLAARGYPVDLVLVQAKGEMIKELSPAVTVHDLQCRNEYYCLPGVIRYLKANQPHVFLSCMDLINLMSVFARWVSKTQTKLLISVQNTTSRHVRSKPKKALEKLLLRTIYPRADGIIAVSNGVAGDLSQYAGIPLHRICTIYNPAISADLHIKMEEPFTHPWFAPGEPPVVLGVGRLVEQKNFTLLMHAFHLALNHVEARLVILGEGEQRSMLESLASHLGIQEQISLPGFSTNPLPYMKRAAVFVLSSDYEGFGNVLVEAMACGCPVVSTDCPSGPAEILASGKYGVLVPPNDVDALADAIVEALTGKRKISVDPAWLDQFRTETVVQKYLEVMGLG